MLSLSVFYLFIAAANVELSSNLNVGATAYDNQLVTFECTVQATGAIVLSWSSDDYVGPGGALLQVASVRGPGYTATSHTNPNTVATLTSVTTDTDTEVTEVVSHLHITASAQHPNSSVSCRLDNQGTPSTITFSKADNVFLCYKMQGLIRKGILGSPSPSIKNLYGYHSKNPVRY
jgi:hypothetical protein